MQILKTGLLKQSLKEYNKLLYQRNQESLSKLKIIMKKSEVTKRKTELEKDLLAVAKYAYFPLIKF